MKNLLDLFFLSELFFPELILIHGIVIYFLVSRGLSFDISLFSFANQPGYFLCKDKASRPLPSKHAESIYLQIELRLPFALKRIKISKLRFSQDLNIHEMKLLVKKCFSIRLIVCEI